MFKTVLKYDCRAVARHWWIIAVATLGLTLFGAASGRILTQQGVSLRSSGVIRLFAGFGAAISAIGVAAGALITTILVYIRFYKNFYTDEGYLTFTLPVKRSTLYLAKVVNALIWHALETVLLIVCLAICLLIIPPTTVSGYLINPVAYRTIGWLIRRYFEVMGGMGVLYLFEALLLIVLMKWASIGLMHFCITAGCILAKKNKVLASIGIYYGVSWILGIAGQLFLSFNMMGFTRGALYYLTILSLPEERALAAVLGLTLCGIAGTAAYLLHQLTVKRVETRLNLA